MHNKCNALESPETIPSLPTRGKIAFHEIGPSCQKDWGLLFTEDNSTSAFKWLIQGSGNFKILTQNFVAYKITL